MAQTSVQPAQKTRVQVANEETGRLFFIDHLRAALVILVVLHHVAVTYGAFTPFYYLEPPLNLGLLVFGLLNQAWFMGAFFLLAGYFTPGSYDRKGAGAFLKSRLVRLGIPLLVFYFALSPLSSIGYWYMPSSLTGITSPLSWQAYPFLLGMGPLWFAAMLLIFDFGYAVWRMLTGNRKSSPMSETSTPSYLGISIFILALALVSYLFRMVVPIGREVLDFPTIAYLPQYLSFFVIGAIASRHDWFRRLPRSTGVAGIVIALAAFILLFPLALSGRMFSFQMTEQSGFVGNGTWQSAVYALWDAITAVGLSLGTLAFFRRLFNEESSFGKFLSRQSYAVYILHIPIIVFIAIALRGIGLPNLLKFGLVALLSVPTCFVIAFIVRKIPGVSRVI